MDKILILFKKLTPLMGKQLPMFSQTVGQFSQSKSNWTGGLMIVVGCYLLLNGVDTVGVQLVGTGIGLITIKDAVNKVGK